MVSESSTSSGRSSRKKWKMADITLSAFMANDDSGLGDVWPSKTSRQSRESRESRESRFSVDSSIVCDMPRDTWHRRNPRLTLIAASDNCSTMDFEGGGPPYHGLDYQVKLQLLPLLERKQGLQFKRVHRYPNPKGGSWLEIECGNEHTHNWLRDNGNISFSTQGVFIRFYPVTARYRHIIARLPLTNGITDKFDLERFRQRCRKQNPLLDTWHWRLVDRKRVHIGGESEARVLLLEVPEETVEYLRCNFWQLFYQLGTINLEPININDESAFESIRVKCCKENICHGHVSFTKNTSYFNNKGLLSICPVINWIDKDEEDLGSEQLIGTTDLSYQSDLSYESSPCSSR